jgi:hypothetical protein
MKQFYHSQFGPKTVLRKVLVDWRKITFTLLDPVLSAIA